MLVLRIFIAGLLIIRYLFASFCILIMCTAWVCWAWRYRFWKAFAAVCMAGIFQVAAITLNQVLFLWGDVLSEDLQFALTLSLQVCVGIVFTLLLYKLRFGKWFCLLLNQKTGLQRTALLLFSLEAVIELFLQLSHGVQPQYLLVYNVLVVVTTVLIAWLVVYLARLFDAAQKMQVQQDIIAQQRLYEQDLESIRQEVRAFRHDYKNLLAGLAQQAAAGEVEELRRTLSRLEAGFDQKLGEKIQASAQLGNLQIPEIRSLLLSKLTVMREKGVACRLEVLYPVAALDMDIWDFVRCLGVLVDNAMEAAWETKQPWVEIILLVRDRQVFLRVSNSYTNSIDPGRLWHDGWSTKGAGRGLGLSSYQHILEGYPNASPCTSWENGVFVQELTLEGRL